MSGFDDRDSARAVGQKRKVTNTSGYLFPDFSSVPSIYGYVHTQRYAADSVPISTTSYQTARTSSCRLMRSATSW